MTAPTTIREDMGEFAATHTADERRLMAVALIAFGYPHTAQALADADAAIRDAEEAAARGLDNPSENTEVTP